MRKLILKVLLLTLVFQTFAYSDSFSSGLSPAKAEKEKTNLVSNPGFELGKGTPADWNLLDPRNERTLKMERSLRESLSGKASCLISGVSSRGGDMIDALSGADKRELGIITGLVPDSYFSAAKFAWMLKNAPAVRAAQEEDSLALGTLDSWLIRELSADKPFITDASTASRTMLYDIARDCWSQRAAGIFGLPLAPLAKIMPSCGQLATLRNPAWNGKSLELRATLTDQPASLFAHGCWQTGEAKMTFGTGCFVLANGGREMLTENTGILNSVAWKIGGQTTLMYDAGVYAAGSLIGWLENSCEWVSKAEHIDQIATAGADNNGLIFVPCLDGLSAPHWRRDTKGVLTGLTLSTKPADIVRAALDGIAHQTADIVECIASLLPGGLRQFRVDGGLSATKYLMQKQADLLGVDILVSGNREMTAIGAAAMAGLDAGVWTRQELLELLKSQTGTVYRPQLSSGERKKQRNKWHRSVKLALQAADDAEPEN